MESRRDMRTIQHHSPSLRAAISQLLRRPYQMLAKVFVLGEPKSATVHRQRHVSCSPKRAVHAAPLSWGFSRFALKNNRSEEL